MSSLPPKPLDSPPRDPQDSPHRRPQRPPPQSYHGSPDDDRTHAQRPDSYAPNNWRQEPIYRRDDYRERGHWDRPRAQEQRVGRPDYGRDRREFDRGGYDRNRPFEPHLRHREPYRHPGRRDISQRRSRSPARWPLQERRRSRSPTRWPPQERRRSRSPARWPPQEPRTRSPTRWPPQDRRPRSRSRSPQRMRLGTHSIASPRRSSPRRAARYSRSRSRGPRRPRSPSPPLNEPAASSTTTTQEEGAIPHKMVPSSTPPGLSTAGEDLPSALSSPAAPTQVIKNIPQDAVLPFDVEISGRTGPSKELVDTSSEQEHPVQLRSTTLSLVPNLSSNNDLIIISPPPREPMADRQAAASDAKLQDKLPTLSSPQLRTQLSSPSNRIRDKTPTSPKQRQARSPSPPKQSRNSGPLGPQAVFIGRGSRSPPRGPRNTSGTHPRGNATPTGPASSYFTGPRGQRRPSALTNPLLVPSPGPSTPQTQSPIPPPLPAPMEDVHVINALAPEATRIPPPIIPVVTLTASLTPDLDKEMANLQAHRARLASEYANFAKEARRALHELDMAAIDLRAAELRRKVADNQHNQAKSGVLGIDYVPTPS